MVQRVLLLLALILLQCFSRVLSNEFEFDLQHQPIRINDLNDLYLTSESNTSGYTLYRFDQIQLACECRSSASHRIFWSINNRILNEHFNVSTVVLDIDQNTVQTPYTAVTCHCLFTLKNRTTIEKTFRYQFFIGKHRSTVICLSSPIGLDLESEPTLKSINYTLQINRVQRRLMRWVQHPHFKVMMPLFFLILAFTCPLILLSWLRSSRYL